MLVAPPNKILAATLERLFPRVMALLRQALKVGGVEKQLGIAAVRGLVVYDLSSNRSAGVYSTLAERLLPKLRVP